MDAERLSLRTEMEHAFAEAALTHGPAFISTTLLRPTPSSASIAETTLLNFYTAFGTHDWEWPDSTSPSPSPSSSTTSSGDHHKGLFLPPRIHGPHASAPQPSLFDALLARLADLSRCGVDAVRARVDDDMSEPDHPLAWLGLHGKARLLRGEDWV